MDNIRATIKSRESISGSIASAGNITAVVSNGISDFDVYSGEYNVVPKIESQTLETKFKSMEENVTIESIPYQEVTNISGGTTATIGGS